MKTFDANQIPRIERPWLQPRYLIHIIMPGETLYLSDRNFTYNGHRYEDYLVNIPETVHSIEESGGYGNISSQLIFKNKTFRVYNSLIEFFLDNPLIFREAEIYVLYLDASDEVFGSDVSTKLHRVGIGEFKNIKRASFTAELSSIVHSLDNKEIFKRINTTDWPNADPGEIGKLENHIYGSIRDVPCQCVVTGAASTLFLDITVSGTTLILSEVDYPIPFPSSGTIKIDDEKITYTGKSSVNKTLTGCTRGASGTSAAIHTRGAPVYLVIATYKYLIAGHICKSAANAKSAQLRLDPENYSITLNDSGKTTIAFTERQILKIQGMHTHITAQSSLVTKYGYSAGTEQAGSWTWSGIEQNMRDQNPATYMGTYNTYEYGGEWARMYVNFLPVMGTIIGSTIHLRHRGALDNVVEGNYIHLRAFWDGGNYESGQLDYSGTIVEQTFPLSPPRLISQVDVFCYEGSWNYRLLQEVYEIWIEYEISGVSPSAADGVYGSPADVIAPDITVDAEGYQDNGAGDYTGTPNALIENPSDMRRHFIIALLGRNAAEIGASFGTTRAEYAARISGGYKFGIVLSRMGEKPSQILKRLDEQSRSNTSEEGGKFELKFNGSTPASVMTLSDRQIIGEPIFDQTEVFAIKDKVRAVYDIDWANSSIFTGWKFGQYKKQTQRGSGTRILDVEFPAIQIGAMADDVADWLLSQHETPWPVVRLICNRAARVLERGDPIAIDYLFWVNLVWKVTEIREIPQRQVYSIVAKAIG